MLRHDAAMREPGRNDRALPLPHLERVLTKPTRADIFTRRLTCVPLNWHLLELYGFLVLQVGRGGAVFSRLPR